MPELPEAAVRPRPLRWAAAFGRFWVDFLIGDTPELFVGAVVALGAAAAIAAAGPAGSRTVAVVVLPLAILTVLALSLLRARRRT